MITRDCIISESARHEQQAAWAATVALACALLLAVAVIGAVVAKGVERVARQWEQREFQEASELAELRGAGPACRAFALPEDYPEAVIEEFDDGLEVGNE